MRVGTARVAERRDLAPIERLRAEALDEIRQLRGGPLYADREAPPLPSSEDEAARLWVGELAGEVVGFLAGRVDGALGTVEAVYVEARCRSVGVGEAMMTAALDWFARRGCTGVDAVALPGARATKNFFEETGFTARLLVMHRRL